MLKKNDIEMGNFEKLETLATKTNQELTTKTLRERSFSKNSKEPH